ncbi:iron chelate uptake ABC transporter family permease subunit [Gordonia alkaliphila]|uniref:iron chelate uptake ABC transporter family permease subunit n=1 Tax=Gordonia alkaliphila TaxID=1053547 RepID=UPI001FF30DD2|nr:iron chelate uptake ABC transporter family permease subunit [Gordonia alkaliphila]MCK0437920.1 iron chelate uptake ABC transporter family permease subunit [Gordonia alkaliphila]
MTLRRVAWFVVACLILVAVTVVSVAVGSAPLPLGTVWSALTAPDGSIDHNTILQLRLPRTVLGLLVGAALGVGGALMQALTRNPLADPGLLGVNAGAALAVAAGVAFFGVTQIGQYLPLSLAGAVLGAILVAAIAARAPGGATGLRLTLVGVAVTAVFNGIAMGLSLLSPLYFDRMRFWGVGSIADRPEGTVAAVAPLIVVGLVLSLLSGRALNTLALGEEMAVAMGTRVAATRLTGVLGLVLMCGAATAAAGPIAFIGLMIPHAVRLAAGVDQRWVMAFAVVLGPALLLTADILGRLVIWPDELSVGVMTPLLGAPVLIWLVRRVGSDR